MCCCGTIAASRSTPSSKRKIAVYLRRIQGAHGGWPLFHDGDFDMSASVKAYFALKMIGDAIDAPHMQRAREAILARGGAIHSNVFTRMLLALFGVLRWRERAGDAGRDHAAAALVSVSSDKISYWARTVIVPLLVLLALKPRAKNPRGVTIDELFVEPPQSIGPPHKAPHQKWTWFLLFRAIDIVLRRVDLSPSACASARSNAPSTSSASGSTARTASAPSSRPWPMPADVRRARRPGEGDRSPATRSTSSW